MPPPFQFLIITPNLNPGTEEATINFKGEIKQVWIVEVTDDITYNAAISTYYIDKSTRQILKQEIEFGGRKMLME